MREKAWMAGAVLAAALVAAGCSSSAKPTAVSTSTTGSSPAATELPALPNKVRPKLPLEFREVKLQIASNRDIKPVGGSGPSTLQRCATLVTPPAQVRPTNQSELLFDRRRAYCYLLGPSLVPSASVGTASVIYDSTSSQWAVNVHINNNDFLNRVANPMVGHQIAVVLAGFVQSAPTINPGITGRDVEIAGGFTQSGAIELASVIMGVAPVSVHVDSTGS
jgi:preprotein translocase subunit SecD